VRKPSLLEREDVIGGLGNSHHHVRRLDDGVDLVADLKPEIVDGLIGDGGGDDGAVDIDANMRGGRALLDVDDLAGERVAGGDSQGPSFGNLRAMQDGRFYRS
jgi:hypothetical protein